MGLETIDDLLARQTFTPFRIKFSTQESVDVRNPALVVVMKRDLFIADASCDRFHLYSLMHVVGVESLANGQARRAPRRKRR